MIYRHLSFKYAFGEKKYSRKVKGKLFWTKFGPRNSENWFGLFSSGKFIVVDHFERFYPRIHMYFSPGFYIESCWLQSIP